MFAAVEQSEPMLAVYIVFTKKKKKKKKKYLQKKKKKKRVEHAGLDKESRDTYQMPQNV